MTDYSIELKTPLRPATHGHAPTPDARHPESDPTTALPGRRKRTLAAVLVPIGLVATVVDGNGVVGFVLLSLAMASLVYLFVGFVRRAKSQPRSPAVPPAVPIQSVVPVFEIPPTSRERVANIRPAAVRVAALTKSYGSGRDRLDVLRDVSVDIESGTFTAVMGPSGSGKSTFMHCAAGLDRATSGEVTIGGTRTTDMNETELTQFRRRHVGFVFQSYNLLPGLTVRQNIELPARLSGTRLDRAWVRTVSERVGLADRMKHRPSQLSGGQQQRVAIARALVARPAVIFADEPTGALDITSGRKVLELLAECVRRDGLTVVMVSHDPTAAACAESVLFLADGQLIGRLAKPTADQIAAQMLAIGSSR